MNLFFLLFVPEPLRVPLAVAVVLIRKEFGVRIGITPERTIRFLPHTFLSGAIVQLVLWKAFYNPNYFPLGPGACLTPAGIFLNALVYSLFAASISQILYRREERAKGTVLEVFTVLLITLLTALSLQMV